FKRLTRHRCSWPAMACGGARVNPSDESVRSRSVGFSSGREAIRGPGGLRLAIAPMQCKRPGPVRGGETRHGKQRREATEKSEGRGERTLAGLGWERPSASRSRCQTKARFQAPPCRKVVSPKGSHLTIAFQMDINILN